METNGRLWRRGEDVAGRSSLCLAWLLPAALGRAGAARASPLGVALTREELVSVRKWLVVVLWVPTSCSTTVGPPAAGFGAARSAWGSCWLCSSSHHHFKWPGQVSWQRCGRVSHSSPEHLKPSIHPRSFPFAGFGAAAPVCVCGGGRRGGSPGAGRSTRGGNGGVRSPSLENRPAGNFSILTASLPCSGKGLCL